MVTLRVEPRGLTKSARNNARQRGFIPAVIYGKQVASTPISVEAVALRDAMKVGARNQLITLEGLDQPHTVLIKEVQLDQTFQDMVHVDFFEPVAGKKVRIRVPIRVRGEDQLTKQGLVMNFQIHEIEVECDPSQVPAYLAVDVSGYEDGQHVSAINLTTPAGVRIMSDDDTVILNVEAAMGARIPEADYTVPTVGL